MEEAGEENTADCANNERPEQLRFQDEYEKFQRNKRNFTDLQKVADLEQRLEGAKGVKDEGGLHFKEGLYEEAIRAYEKADELFGNIFVKTYSYFDDSDSGGDSDNETQDRDEDEDQPQQSDADPASAVRRRTITLTATCRCNMCVCYMKLQNWTQAVEQATNALTYAEKGSKMQVKVLFNRGKAEGRLGLLTSAKADLKAAVKIDQGNKAVRLELQDVLQKIKAKRPKAGFLDNVLPETDQSHNADSPTANPKLNQGSHKNNSSKKTDKTSSKIDRTAFDVDQGENPPLLTSSSKAYVGTDYDKWSRLDKEIGLEEEQDESAKRDPKSGKFEIPREHMEWMHREGWLPGTVNSKLDRINEQKKREKKSPALLQQMKDLRAQADAGELFPQRK